MDRWLWVAVWMATAWSSPLPQEVDSEQTRKLLGSSVVTSVSVIMDHGNGTKTYLKDREDEKKPQIVGTPGTLMSPDRYEFYSFGDDGELVKKLMTMDQIQSLIAAGDDLEPLPIYEPQHVVDNNHAEGVHKVLQSVQNVLKGELQAAKVHQKVPSMQLPDESWSILLPGLLNSDLDFKDAHIPVKTEPTPTSTSKKPTPTTTRRPQTTTIKHTTTNRPVSHSTSTTTQLRSTVRPTTQYVAPSTNKLTTEYKSPSTSAPYIKTTAQAPTKPASQKPLPLITTKIPPSSTKKPYVSESTKVPTPGITKPEPTTNKPWFVEERKPTTNKPWFVEERKPTTKFPETKKPIPEKQKPSGIPTITHYLPLSSMSPSSQITTTQSLTTPSFAETTSNQKFSSTTKEPMRVTTKRPQPVSTTQSLKLTNRPLQNIVPTTYKPQSNDIYHNKIEKTKQPATTTAYITKTTTVPTLTVKETTRPSFTTLKETARPTITTTKETTRPIVTTTKETTRPIVTTTKETTRPKVTTTKGTTNPTVTTIKETTIPTITEMTKPNIMNKFTTTTEILETISTNDLEQTITTIKDILLPNSDKIIIVKQPEIQNNNLIAENTDIVNTRVKPPVMTTLSSSTITTYGPTEATTATMTPLAEKLTTFSYTSKITPSGEVVTEHIYNSVEPSNPTTVTPMETLATSTKTIPTKKPTTLIVEEIEISQLKNNIQHQLLARPSENIEHVLISTSMQQTHPTTYHPHNFSLPSREPQISSSPTTPVTPSPLKVSTIPEPQNLTFMDLTTTLLPTESSVESSTSTMKLQTYISTDSVPVATTPQEVTKQTTLYAEESTPERTTAALNTTTEPTINESNYSTEEMPLQQIPLKIYESLKDSNSGQDIMTTIISDNLSTTPSKSENIYHTNAPETTTLSGSTLNYKTVTVEVMETTIVPAESQNKLVIFNNSESLVLENNSISELTTTESELNASTNNPMILTTTTLEETNKNTTLKSKIQDETTTVSGNTKEQDGTETTPNFDSTTLYKDQILQDGISAVTSILLNEAQKQQEMLTMTNDDLQNIKTTTEEQLLTTTVSDMTETTTGKFITNNDIDDIKSEVRIDEEAELIEKVTTESVETTTQEVKQKVEMQLVKEEAKNNSSNKQEFKKNDQKVNVVPSKESKLNPESDQDVMKKIPVVIPVSRTTPAPEFSASTERLKLQEFDNPIHKPISTFAKKPSSVYQTLDSIPQVAIELNPAPYESMGLEASIAFLSEDVRRFADLCNELAFKMWTSITGKGQIVSRSLVMSPFAVTSLLAMVFLGARGPTSGQMNDVLRLDDMVTFNPHQVFQNVTESVINSKNSGVATAAFVRELYSDKTKGKILDFYKERVQQYYQGHVEEVSFAMIGDIIRRRTNLLVKRQTLGKVPEYLRGSSLNMRSPLAAFSANIFQTDCEHASTEGRDGEMYFVVRPSTRQRRLVPVPAVVWRSGFLAGYEPSLDATSVCLGPESIVSTILILPGQQGQVAPGDGLARLEQRLIETSYRRGTWSQILRSLMPRPGLELQIPRFSHRSVLNMTGSLQKMGLKDLFSAHRADLRGLNGISNDLHLSDMLQINTFSTCGEETIGARHHVETYPASPQRMGRVEHEPYPPKELDIIFRDVPLTHRTRQARLPDNPRLRFDRPFLYVVRHNPSGIILHMGRFNPRLLP